MHFSKQFIPISISDDGINISFKEMQPENEFFSIFFTEGGIFTDFNDVQLEKEPFSSYSLIIETDESKLMILVTKLSINALSVPLMPEMKIEIGKQQLAFNFLTN